MTTNAFVPIRPIPESSSGYQNFLNFLANAGAVTNLADSIMYRHLDDPKVSVGYPEEQSYRPSMRNTHLKDDLVNFMSDGVSKDKLLKAEPLMKNISVRNLDMPSDTLGTYVNHNEGNNTGRVWINTSASVPAAEYGLKHEGFGHGATDIRMGNEQTRLSGMPKPNMFDNKTGKIYSFEDYLKSEDLYNRSTPEIMSESNIAKDKTMSSRYATEPNTAVMSNKQVHPIYPRFMQNIKKLGRTIPALTIPSEIIGLKKLYDGIKKDGVSHAYSKWLGLEEGKDYVTEGKNNPRMY